MTVPKRHLRRCAVATVQVLVLSLSFTPTVLAVITDGENASNVLGQSNFTSGGFATTQAGMYDPSGAIYDATGNRLFVADINNSRVLVFDVTSISDGQNAVHVLGQSNFTSGGGATTQSGMGGPDGGAYDATGKRLFVAETGNNRVLVFDVTSISDGQNAVHVLGQSNFTSGGTATTQAGMHTPNGMAYDATGNRLFVADANNNRVLVFDVTSISDGQNAVHVLGQSNFTSNGFATTQAGMHTPSDVAYDGTGKRLFVADAGNNRVLVFDMTSISDGQNAVHVLGQSNFTSGGTATTQAGMYTPGGMAYDATGKRLFVTDIGNNRLLVFNNAEADGGGQVPFFSWWSLSLLLAACGFVVQREGLLSELFSEPRL